MEAVEMDAGGDTEGSTFLSLERLFDRFLFSGDLLLLLVFGGLTDLSRLLSLSLSLERLGDLLLRFALLFTNGERLLDFFLRFTSFGERLLLLSLLCFPGGERLLDFFLRCFFFTAAGDLLLEREDRLGDLGIV